MPPFPGTTISMYVARHVRRGVVTKQRLIGVNTSSSVWKTSMNAWGRQSFLGFCPTLLRLIPAFRWQGATRPL